MDFMMVISLTWLHLETDTSSELCLLRLTSMLLSPSNGNRLQKCNDLTLNISYRCVSVYMTHYMIVATDLRGPSTEQGKWTLWVTWVWRRWRYLS